ncbi:MAG: PilC/PilY family type IV pilus protein [Pseudomonadota bacterium]
MDGWHLIGGSDPASRSNITRNALRSLLNTYHGSFNWGLTIFETTGSAEECADNNGLCGNYTNYEGTLSTMRFTNDCVSGISNSNGGLKCIPNPEPNGYNFVTYERGAPDGSSNSVIATYNKNWAWGLYSSTDPTQIDIFSNHNPNVTTWLISNDNSISYNQFNDFKNPLFGYNPIDFSGDCIDSNESCSEAFLARQLYIKTDFVYLQDITGKAKVIEPIAADSSLHYNNLLKFLAPETASFSNADIKNGASETPLIGSIITAQNYYSGTLTGVSSPIQNSCQKNYVLLATDGQPTAKANGLLYSSSAMSNATTGRAYTDLYTEIQKLRNINVGGKTYDVQTYVLGIGDITEDTVGIAGLNKMAQYGGTNQAYFATDATSMQNSFQNIVNNISYNIPPLRGNGHIAISNNAGSTNTFIYRTFYTAEGNKWAGNIVSNTPKYSYSNNLVTYDTDTTYDLNKGAAKWLVNDMIDNKSRQIITAIRENADKPLQAVAFQWNQLNSFTKNMFIDSTANEQQLKGNQRLNYVRGDRTNESNINNTNGFRTRATSVLGDIIDSSPVYLGIALAGYSDSDFPKGTASYIEFSKNTATRRRMIYVGANDGMLHGFDAATLKEVFSYVPNSVLSKFINFSSSTYTHDYFVNETPLISDIPSSTGWKTQLIGFLGIGGTGLFALDVTDLGSGSLDQAEANSKNIVLWELNSQDDHDIGYIINRGQINQQKGGLTNQIGQMNNRRWAVVTGNGYNSNNNSTGLIISYLDAKNGVPSYKKIMIAGETGGLSAPTLVDINYDGLVDYAYAGDLKGNVWRFDLQGNESQWSAFKLFIPNSDWAISPITTAPSVALHCSLPGLIIVVGTGKFLEKSDTTSKNTEYLMGLWDKMDNNPITFSNLTEQWYYSDNNFANPNQNVPDIAKSLIITSDNTVDWTQKRGWYLPIFDHYPKPGRILTPPFITRGSVYFNTITSDDIAACSNGKIWSTSQAIDFCTGGRPKSTIFDINYDGKITSDDKYDLWDSGNKVNVTGITLKDQGVIFDSSVWINPKQMTCTGTNCTSLTTGYSDGIGVNLFSEPPKKISWREISI